MEIFKQPSEEIVQDRKEVSRECWIIKLILLKLNEPFTPSYTAFLLLNKNLNLQANCALIQTVMDLEGTKKGDDTLRCMVVESFLRF